MPRCPAPTDRTTTAASAPRKAASPVPEMRASGQVPARPLLHREDWPAKPVSAPRNHGPERFLTHDFRHRFSLGMRTAGMQTARHFFFRHPFDSLQDARSFFSQAWPCFVRDHICGQRLDGRGFEQHDRRQIHPKHIAQARNDLRGQHGIAAQSKKSSSIPIFSVPRMPPRQSRALPARWSAARRRPSEGQALATGRCQLAARSSVLILGLTPTRHADRPPISFLVSS